MIRDARTLDPGAMLSADVCVIGAGPAGITLARDLVGPTRSVILLEAGGRQGSQAQQELYAGTLVGRQTWDLDNCRFRGLGGSTALWAGWCRPLDRADFTARPELPLSGWPISYDDLLPWYQLATRTVEAGPFIYDAQAVADASGLPLLDTDASRVVSNLYQYSPPTRFGTRYLPDLEASDGPDVYVYANVVEILADGGAVSRVHCRTVDGTELDVEASVFVLATGGIENARLLLASGLANSSGMLGRLFMEHPHYYNTAIFHFAPGLADMSLYNGTTVSVVAPESGEQEEISVRAALSLSDELRVAEGLLHFGIELLFSDIDAGQSGLFSVDDVGQLLPGSRDEETAFRLTFRVEQSPQMDNRIELGDELDAIGLPRTTLYWDVPQLDDENLTKAMAFVGAEIGRAGLGRMWIPRNDQDLLVGSPRAGCHHLGTTRMSERPEDGVVDADCRTHDLSNLYIAGSSVFCTGGFANPTLTIVALAHRLAAHLDEVV